ncbi:SEFIR domain-containing protein [Saccharothrix xinjiangensis]|uniref:SEFIR domain-containing protein n=1 Tax=Saccharothrix xinjiangensis TaxID=204798 RepID=A0ABV9XTP7_9PSEU
MTGTSPRRVFISYAHESDRHAELVRRLWVFLRECGIDVRLDRETASRRTDWALWMADQIRSADHVLVIASTEYRRRAEGRSGPADGRGAQWEARLIRDAFYADQRALDRFLPVVLPGESTAGVPDFLAPATSTVYAVSDFTVPGAEALLRVLLDQPWEAPPALGTPPLLPRRDDAPRPAAATGPGPAARDLTGPDLAPDPVVSATYPFLRSPTSACLGLWTSPDGARPATADNDRRVWFYDVDRPVLLSRVRADSGFWTGGGAPHVALPPGAVAVTGCGRVLKFHALPAGALAHEVRVPAEITGLAPLPGADLVAVATADDAGLTAWSVASCAPVAAPWSPPGAPVTAVAASGDGTALFFARGPLVTRLDRASGARRDWTAAGPVTRLATSWDGDRFATSTGGRGRAGHYQLWRADRRDPHRTSPHAAYYPSVALDPSGSLVALNRDHAMHVIRFTDQAILGVPDGREGHVAFAAGGRDLVVADNPNFAAPGIRRLALRRAVP